MRPDGIDERLLPSLVDRVVGVQPLGEGRTAVLVEDPNELDPSKRPTRLVVFDAGGTEVASADAGPDTCALIATTDDSLWVGYSDIGHYADHPLAWQGLARFDASLSDTVSHRASDLALLNVTDDVVFAAGYACTELLRVTNGQATSIASTELSYGSLLVDGDRAALVGGTWRTWVVANRGVPVTAGSGTWTGYDVAVPVSLAAGGIQITGPGVRLVAPDGRELPGWRARTARGPDLHVVADRGREWWRLDLDDLPFWP